MDAMNYAVSLDELVERGFDVIDPRQEAELNWVELGA